MSKSTRGGKSDGPVKYVNKVKLLVQCEEQLAKTEVPRPIYAVAFKDDRNVNVKVLGVELMGIRKNYETQHVDVEVEMHEVEVPTDEVEVPTDPSSATSAKKTSAASTKKTYTDDDTTMGDSTMDDSEGEDKKSSAASTKKTYTKKSQPQMNWLWLLSTQFQ